MSKIEGGCRAAAPKGLTEAYLKEKQGKQLLPRAVGPFSRRDQEREKERERKKKQRPVHLLLREEPWPSIQNLVELYQVLSELAH